MSTLIQLIVAIPFTSALFMGLLYIFTKNRGMQRSIYTVFGLAAPLSIAVLAIMVGAEVLSQTPQTVTIVKAFTWVSIGKFDVEMAFLVDRLSAVMIFFITFIGSMIHIYASGYMRDDEGYGKFFSYFNFFIGSMLLLVLADNPYVMFIGWELVGLASYLLIGFYFNESPNVSAANKAFYLNRVGDFGFVIGLALLFLSFENFGINYLDMEAHIKAIDPFILGVIGVFLFVGAMGKSAQIPLYVWLPDAMAGPTPVSALIHAATMVTAGVYMVARFGFLYNEVPDVGEYIATIGAASALFAAIIAAYQSDIKKVLAYSTMSQLGYMFMAVGLQAYSFGIFHVFTHAFFKALLFMSAGAVIVAMHHEQNIFKMGNLRKFIPVIFILMLIGCLAISGIPPFAGFFSKDAIINHAYLNGNYVIWMAGVVTAFLTAFYMFRMLFIVFLAGKSEHKTHEVPNSMIAPLFVLALGATFAGFLNANDAFGGDSWFSTILALPDHLHHPSLLTDYILDAINVAFASAGLYLAYRLYAKEAKAPDLSINWNKLAYNKFYVDEFYHAVVVTPIKMTSKVLDTIIDRYVFDGIINTMTFSYRGFATLFAMLQNGKVRFYAFYILLGVSIMSLSMLTVLVGK